MLMFARGKIPCLLPWSDRHIFTSCNIFTIMWWQILATCSQLPLNLQNKLIILFNTLYSCLKFGKKQQQNTKKITIKKINRAIKVVEMYNYQIMIISCWRLTHPAGHELINNYWMRLSMISWIIKTEVCVICRSRSLRQITQTRRFDNSYDIMWKPNSIIVLLYIFHIIHPQKQKRSVQPFCFWGEHYKGLSN